MTSFEPDVLRTLAAEEPRSPVLSLYLRTDPREPANTSSTPGWQIELRNGLRAIDERLHGADDKGTRQWRAFEALRDQIQHELLDESPGELKRSAVWFLRADGETLARCSLQVPVRKDMVVWDDRPFISPLAEVADRWSPSGVILVRSDFIRLFEIAYGEITEPEDSYYELELGGDWRPYEAYAAANPARGQQSVTHRDRFEARVEEHRGQLYRTAAAATAERAQELGWQRVMIVAEGQFATAFREELPDSLRSQIFATLDLNLGHADVPDAESLQALAEADWRERTGELLAKIMDRARAGGAAAIGARETLEAAAEGRVDHLVVDPFADFTEADLNGHEVPPELLGERAVESVIAGAGLVTVLDVSDSADLGAAGGMAALLRY